MKRCRVDLMILCALAVTGSLAAESQAVAVAELSPRAEAAIDRGLAYLRSTQQADGSWGVAYPAADTAVALMAFMLQGHFPGRGDHGPALDAGLAWLLRRGVEGRGYLGGARQGGMYEHGLATLALSEAWGESAGHPELRELLTLAVDVILRSQNDEGGWRYAPQPRDADISVTVMQIVALTSAREAGIQVPDRTIERALHYVKRCQNPTSGGFGYQPGKPPGFARTAAGVTSLIMGGEVDSERVRRGLQYLVQVPESKFVEIDHYFYSHYYAIQAVYQAGDAYFQPWYPRIRDALLARQHQDGSWPGSPDPVFCSAMSILILGVPYRFLPIYQR